MCQHKGRFCGNRVALHSAVGNGKFSLFFVNFDRYMVSKNNI